MSRRHRKRMARQIKEQARLAAMKPKEVEFIQCVPKGPRILFDSSNNP